MRARLNTSPVVLCASFRGGLLRVSVDWLSTVKEPAYLTPLALVPPYVRTRVRVSASMPARSRVVSSWPIVR